MPRTTALGADSLLGLVIDDVADNANVGHPGLDSRLVAAPTTKLTAADGGAGNLTGSFYYFYSYVVEGAETTPAPVADVLSVTNKNAALSDILVCPDTRCTERKIYRNHTDNTTTYAYWVGSVFDNTTTTFTDSLVQTSADIDTLNKPKATNETSGNWMLAFPQVISHTLGATYGNITSAELTGKLGMAKAIPGRITVGGNIVEPARGGALVPIMCGLYGTPTETQQTSTGVYTYAFAVSTADDSPRTLTALVYKGGGIAPEFLYGLSTTQYVLTIAEGALVQDNATLVGCHHSLSGPATEQAGGSTYTGTLVARGIRTDALAASAVVDVKVTTAPSGGTFALKYDTGGTPSYSGSAQTCYYDTSTKQQEQGGSQVSDWIEALTEGGLALGYDDCENRLPYQIMFTGAVDGLQLNDEFAIPYSILIPGGTGTGYTAVPPRKVSTCRYTSAHAYLKVDGSTIEAQSATMTLTAPKQPIYSLGPEARTVLDMVRNGFYAGQIQFVRRYSGRTYENVLRTNDRVAFQIVLQGPYIATKPGTLSAYRESVTFDFPQCRVESSTAQVAGPGVINETVVLVVEQPDNAASEVATVTINTKQNWQLL